MSWLKSLGGACLKVVGVGQKLIPLAQAFVPGGGEIAAVVNTIGTIEQIYAAVHGPEAKKGSEKLNAAAPYVAQIIQNSDALRGKKIVDEARAADAVKRITSDFADLLNCYGE